MHSKLICSIHFIRKADPQICVWMKEKEPFVDIVGRYFRHHGRALLP